MKKLSLLVLVAIALLDCKKEFKEPVSTLESVAGRWRLIEKQIILNGQEVWQQATDPSPYSFTISSQGAILNSSGLQECCVPETFVLNGDTITIKSPAELPPNPVCARVNCAPCESWVMEQVGNELMINYCGQERAKYIRE